MNLRAVIAKGIIRVFRRSDAEHIALAKELERAQGESEAAIRRADNVSQALRRKALQLQLEVMQRRNFE